MVGFKPWSLELAVHDLSISKAAPAGARSPSTGQTLQFHVRRIYIDTELQSLLRLSPVTVALVVDKPVALLTHLGQGRYNTDDMLARFETPDSTA